MGCACSWRPRSGCLRPGARRLGLRGSAPPRPCTPLRGTVIGDFSVRRGRSTERGNPSSFVGPDRARVRVCKVGLSAPFRVVRPAFPPQRCYANQVTSLRRSPQLRIKLQTGSGRASGREVCAALSRSAACLGLAIFKIFSSRILPPSCFPSSLLGNLFLASRQGPHKEGNPQGIRCRGGNSTRLRWTLQPTSSQITLHLFPTDRMRQA